MTDANEGEYTFKKAFKEIPAVTVSVHDNGAATDSASVIVSIYDLTTTGFKVRCTANITAEVFIQAIEVTI